MRGTVCKHLPPPCLGLWRSKHVGKVVATESYLSYLQIARTRAIFFLQLIAISLIFKRYCASILVTRYQCESKKNRSVRLCQKAKDNMNKNLSLKAMAAAPQKIRMML